MVSQRVESHAMSQCDQNIFSIKIHSLLKQCCSVYENKVLQLMSAWLSLERFRESILFSYAEDRSNIAFLKARFSAI